MNYSTDQIDHICETMIADLGVDPSAIYCQFTGAPIGHILRDHLGIILSMLPAEMDLESIMDDLFTRTITSMRPSPAFNLIRGESLNQMRKVVPRELTSLLLGRFYRPRDTQYSNIKRTLPQRLADGQKQILLFQQLGKLDFTTSEARWFLHHLIELDSQFDLTLVDKLADFPKDSTQLDFTPENLALYTESLASLIKVLHAKKDALERKAMLHQSWLAAGGNRQLRTAHMGSFMELTPPSPTKAAIQAKEARKGSIRMLLRQIMEDSNSDDSTATPIAKPIPAFVPAIMPNGMPRLKLNRGAL